MAIINRKLDIIHLQFDSL